MRLHIERTVCARQPDGSLTEPRSLADYQNLRAWVLLGDPGAGKTTTFDTLASQCGHRPITARDFIELEAPRGGYPTPIFIDGLDESAALEGQSPLGRIRSKLSTLGTPPFRLSCREADWRGSTDNNDLQRLVGEGEFAELHLTELTTEQILQFTAHWLEASDADAQAFVDQAHQHDMEGLLTNPQTLRMLVEAVGNSAEGWPRSKAEVYEKACAKLVQEQNEVHLDAQRRNTIPDAQLLNAAGYLCAVMLLSGSSVIALQRQKQDAPHAMVLNMLLTDGANTPSINACSKVLETHLFSSDGKGNFTPVHRTVAEYLGAKYLADRILHHLPATRALALIQGEDGGVVPELRGLHAWLAVVTDEGVRRTLIDHDALGLVLHGDVLRFSVHEKVHLLHALLQEAQRYAHFRRQNWASKPFGALATPDMEATFQELLQSPDRSPAHQAVLNCVLDAMKHGQAMPVLQKYLETIVRDNTYAQPYRKEALQICLRNATESNIWNPIITLLNDVSEERIEDGEDELLGTLLLTLYPGQIRAERLWDYWRKPKSGRFFGSYWRFWKSLASDIAPKSDLPILLDALLERGIQIKHGHQSRAESDTVGALLSAGIATIGECIEIPHLYRWLSLGVGPHHSSALQEEHKAEIASWLSARPAIYKALCEYGITVLEKTEEPVHTWLYDIAIRFCRAKRPDDAAEWYLQLAVQRTDAFRSQLIAEAFSYVRQNEGGDAALELIEHWLAQHHSDIEWAKATLLSCKYPPEDLHREHIAHDIEYKQRLEEESRQRLQFFREHLPSLIHGPAHLGVLNAVGETYLNFYSDSQEVNPNSRLLELLNNDSHWVDMAVAGLRNCLHRTDLPSAGDVLALHFKNQHFNLALPCLAAMELRYAENRATTFDLPASTLETVIAFRLTNHYGDTPLWFKEIIQRSTPLVARVLQQLVQQSIAKNREHVEGLYALAHDAEYAALAALTLPTLIAQAPSRASKKQLKHIELLAVALLHQLDQDQQLTLLAYKLQKTPMDVAQRVCWLTAGTQVESQHYLEKLKEFVGTKQARASHIFEFLHTQRQEDKLFSSLDIPAKQYFIELLGRRFLPEKLSSNGVAHWVTPTMESTQYVGQLISSLGADFSHEAQSALASLLANKDLLAWKMAIQHAIYEQNILRRKALFRPASVTEVCNTLANLQPANAADLRALVVDQLNLLAHEIRHGNTNDYTQYWNGDKPRIENDCRDALLSDLKRLLKPLNIIAEPERTHADQKRADIEVFFGSTLHIPIEIKRDSHKDVWKAIHEQLIAKYSREQGSDGYGVYIVFWFNAGNLHVAGDGGHKPKTSEELQQRLAATVPRELQHKISVLVIDCAKP